MDRTDTALAEMSRGLPSGSVLTDADTLTRYAHDESDVPPVTPRAAVRVTSAADVSTVLRVASDRGVPVTARAGGTGRVGGAVPHESGIVLALEGMGTLRDLDVANMTASVEPGVITGALHAAAESAGLFYPPDPNSSASCAVGGNIATNAGGPRTFKYGVTREHVLGLEVVTGDGSVLQLGRRTRKGVTGYDLTALMVGSEGTLAIITGATLKLVPKPERVFTLLVMLDDEQTISAIPACLMGGGIVPRCVEFLDSHTLALARPDLDLPIAPEVRAMVIVELDGDGPALDRQLELAGNLLLDAGALDVLTASMGRQRERLWAARQEMSRSLRRAARHKISEDVVVPCTRLGDLLGRIRQIAEASEVPMPTYGHAGDGNLHVNFLWDDPGRRPAVERAILALFKEVLALGGTLSGEHGIGLAKAPYLPLEQSAELIAYQQRIKDVFDPSGILNPGKVLQGQPGLFHGAC